MNKTTLYPEDISRMTRPEMERTLAERIQTAWDRYEASIRDLSPSEILGQMEEISSVQMCRDSLLSNMELYSDEHLTFLLSLFDPLDQLRDLLKQEQEADQTEQVNSAIRSLREQAQAGQQIGIPEQSGMTME